MNIFLVRHGESKFNITKIKTVPDHVIPLTDKGIEQSEIAGGFLNDYFQHHKIKGVRMWISPYLRTRQTSEHIFGQAQEYINDVREHINLCEQQWGLFDGLSNEEIENKYPDENQLYKEGEKFKGRFWVRMPLGESRFDVAVRVHQSFGTFHRDNINNIIVVTHGTTLRAFVMQWLHKSPEWFEDEPNPGNCWIRLITNNQDLGYIHKG